MFTGWLVLKRAPALLALVAFSAFGQTTHDVVIEGYLFAPAEGGLEFERLFPGEAGSVNSISPGATAINAGRIRR